MIFLDDFITFVLFVLLYITNLIVLPVFISGKYEKQVSTAFIFSAYTLFLYIILAIIPYTIMLLIGNILDSFITKIRFWPRDDTRESWIAILIGCLISITINFFIIKGLNVFLKAKIIKAHTRSTKNDSRVMSIYSIITAICSFILAVGVTLIIFDLARNAI